MSGMIDKFFIPFELKNSMTFFLAKSICAYYNGIYVKMTKQYTAFHFAVRKGRKMQKGWVIWNYLTN